VDRLEEHEKAKSRLNTGYNISLSPITPRTETSNAIDEPKLTEAIYQNAAIQSVFSLNESSHFVMLNSSGFHLVSI
jgi:hypothetical protein